MDATTTTDADDSKKASDLAKLVIAAVTEGKADDTFATQVARDFAALSPTAMYFFIVQTTGGLKANEQQKAGLRDFNLLLNKEDNFKTGMAALHAWKLTQKT